MIQVYTILKRISIVSFVVIGVCWLKIATQIFLKLTPPTQLDFFHGNFMECLSFTQDFHIADTSKYFVIEIETERAKRSKETKI